MPGRLSWTAPGLAASDHVKHLLGCGYVNGNTECQGSSLAGATLDRHVPTQDFNTFPHAGQSHSASRGRRRGKAASVIVDHQGELSGSGIEVNEDGLSGGVGKDVV